MLTGLLVTAALVLAPADALWPLVSAGSPWAADRDSGREAETAEVPGLGDASLAGSAGIQGTVSVSVAVRGAEAGAKIPIYRFYSPTSGTHFYTPSEQERDTVMARWPHIWSYEGIAYTVDPAKNSQPLYRFYTASEAERDLVLARWMNVYQYDGETYRVTPQADSSKSPVYRFFNVRNGSHFYTANPDERDAVLARWPDIYQLEGTAFWLGQ